MLNVTLLRFLQTKSRPNVTVYLTLNVRCITFLKRYIEKFTTTIIRFILYLIHFRILKMIQDPHLKMYSILFKLIF